MWIKMKIISFKYYANKDDLVITVDYLIKLLEDAKARLKD